MNTPENLGTEAAERVRTLLLRRLDSAGFRTNRPDAYFDVSVNPAQRSPDGWQVRVRTWKHWSDARVEFDANDGARLLIGIDRLCEPASQRRLTQDEAMHLAAKLVTIPSDARLLSFRHEPYAPHHIVARLEWEHWHHDLRVDGDYLWMQIHPETGTLVASGCKWRRVNL